MDQQYNPSDDYSNWTFPNEEQNYMPGHLNQMIDNDLMNNGFDQVTAFDQSYSFDQSNDFVGQSNDFVGQTLGTGDFGQMLGTGDFGQMLEQPAAGPSMPGGFDGPPIPGLFSMRGPTRMPAPFSKSNLHCITVCGGSGEVHRRHSKSELFWDEAAQQASYSEHAWSGHPVLRKAHSLPQPSLTGPAVRECE